MAQTVLSFDWHFFDWIDHSTSVIGFGIIVAIVVGSAMSMERIRTVFAEIGNAVSAIFYTIPRFTPNYLTQEHKYTCELSEKLFRFWFFFFFEKLSWRFVWIFNQIFRNKHCLFFVSFYTARSILYALINQAKSNIFQHITSLILKYNMENSHWWQTNKQANQNIVCQLFMNRVYQIYESISFFFRFSLTEHLLHIQPIT